MVYCGFVLFFCLDVSSFEYKFLSVSVSLLRAAIALLTRKYFLDMQIYSQERAKVCVRACSMKVHAWLDIL